MTYNEVSTHGHKFRVESFGSAQEFCRTLDGREYRSEFDGDPYKSSGDWACGVFKTGAKAREQCRNGYTEPVHDIQVAVGNAIRTLPQKKQTRCTSGVVGFAPIVPNALLGLPNSMISTKYRNIKGKVVDFMVGAAVSCGVTAQQMQEGGKKILESVVKLEKRGYRVRITTIDTFCQGNEGDVLILCIKSENEPLTLSRITFPMMTSAMQRVMGFRWYSSSPHTRYYCGYGHPWYHDFKEQDRLDIMREFLGRPNSNAVYVELNSVIKEGEDYLTKCLNTAIKEEGL